MPDTAARDALAAKLREMGLFKSTAFAEGAADAILADLTTDGFTLHPVTGPLDAESLTPEERAERFRWMANQRVGLLEAVAGAARAEAMHMVCRHDTCLQRAALWAALDRLAALAEPAP